tara:strand:- start:5 stop:997 length:993 start_codon:yes stop_codon:yes gene_type:complete
MSELKTNKIATNDTNNVAIDDPLKLKNVTTTQRDALSSPQAGDMVYNSTEGTIDFYNGSAWFSTSSSTFTFGLSYVVVAGGGGGATAWNSANRGGGGGGAGGYRSSFGSESSGGGATTESTLNLSFSTNYTVSIGSGGTGGSGGYFQDGTKGSDSTFATITCLGGGGSGDGSDSLNDGGSGAGAAYSEGAGTGTAGQGYAGGGRNTSNNYSGGSGGGAGAVGTYGPNRSSAAVAGGAGVTSSITGSAVERAKGGGSRTGGAGSANTGNGGEGREGTSAFNGGSGVVILRWTTADATISVGAGLTDDGGVQTAGSDSYIVFTAGTGTISFS